MTLRKITWHPHASAAQRRSCGNWLTARGYFITPKSYFITPKNGAVWTVRSPR